MVLNAAVQMLREADELKINISKFKSGTSMLQERNLWVTQQQLQKVYQKVLVLDLDYALDKKVEQDLWNIGFKQQIEALQAISKDRKNPLRSEGQAMLSWVLQAAAGFYLCLLHQICTTFKLDLPFRRRASLLGWVEGWGAGEAAAGARLPAAGAARYICQHCLVHLGDLARYRHQLRVANTFYRQAVSVWAHSGQPYNQLALVARVRARRVSALYWHVRALLVRAPFPPAADNLRRALRSAALSPGTREVPVLGSAPVAPAAAPSPAPEPGRLDAHSYVTDLIRAMHLIHSLDDLDTAATLVKSLNSSLSGLVVTDSFESMTIIKMACMVIWLVHSATEDLTVDSSALTESERVAVELSGELAGGTLLALLLPAYTVGAPPKKVLPALKVWVQWWVAHPQASACGGRGAWGAVWGALSHALNALAHDAAHARAHAYETVPLPEDEELHGFVPLESALRGLRFHKHAAWDTYGARLPDVDSLGDKQCPSDVVTSLSAEPELEQRVRAHRLVQLGKRLAEQRPQHFTYTCEEGVASFSSPQGGGAQLAAMLAALRLSPPPAAAASDDTDSDDEPAPPPPPVVISEADFREKVREKRVGILKPQGSLERAREERALATTQEEQQEVESPDENSKSEDKKESKKPRVNIAMAAIMRKQEETNKQVKFVTPPPTPDSTSDATEQKDAEKPKIIQPKAIKSLANLPLGRKTGGILSLKDKSAGYPHLVNAEPEPAKKPEKEEKKDSKPSQGSSQNSQSFQAKRQEQPVSPSWAPNIPQNYDAPRMGLQKNYGIQNSGIVYNPNYQASPNSQGIRLPVVNPKEIDVRTAALQKQNSRQELFQDVSKFGNHGYQISGDKKNFLNDLPPRFANQYRHWQNAQENQFNDNQYRDDSFKPNDSTFNSQPARVNWMAPQPPDSFQQPSQWWKTDNQPNYSTNYMNMQPNYFAPRMNTALTTPYRNAPTFSPAQNNIPQQSKQESVLGQTNYLQPAIGQPQIPTLQNLVASPNFNSSMNSFGSYAPTVGYDSSMYPQFGSNKLGYHPMQMKMMDKPLNYQGNSDMMDLGVGFGTNGMDPQQRNLGMSFNEPLNDVGGMKNMDQMSVGESVVTDPTGNTYSLFSAEAPWAPAQRHPQQSLWSGPGPSPLERLLEQQKQMNQPPAPQ
ncbi:uncharacterized protein LOC115451696 isoform X2 [Manduca sexta]|uniref:uncharacterized protein LOC115451696 isoform X2 n=1 Tax=Manduca sexta TaxID=7130 RepID=UPI0018901551|nr:uncharacterized protein LOC115451696 isoform X2 [Manduca sexta]